MLRKINVAFVVLLFVCSGISSASSPLLWPGGEPYNESNETEITHSLETEGSSGESLLFEEAEQSEVSEFLLKFLLLPIGARLASLGILTVGRG